MLKLHSFTHTANVSKLRSKPTASDASPTRSAQGFRKELTTSEKGATDVWFSYVEHVLRNMYGIIRYCDHNCINIIISIIIIIIMILTIIITVIR